MNTIRFESMIILLLAGFMVGTSGIAQNATSQKVLKGAVLGQSPQSQPIPCEDMTEAFENSLANAWRYEVGSFVVAFMPDTGTIAFLGPTASGPDFTPNVRGLKNRLPGFHQLGDVTVRYRYSNEQWKQFATVARKNPPKFIDYKDESILRADDLSNCGEEPVPFKIERKWIRRGEALVMRFELHNRTQELIEIGSFGAPMVFNTWFQDPKLGDHRIIHEQRFYVHPYVGGDAGYLQVTRVDGRGPVLLVLPGQNTGFEAYRHITEHPWRRTYVFEGFYEWMIHSKAYIEDQEWPGDKQWNLATSCTVEPGQTIAYEFLFVLAPSIRNVEDTLVANDRPLVVGFPNYVLPLSEFGRLFVKENKTVQDIAVSPSGSMEISPLKEKSGTWQGYSVEGKQPGRCRVEITYHDGLKQYVHYNVIASQAEQVRRIAAFHDTYQWFDDPNDSFGRTYAYIPYDRDNQRLLIDDKVTYVSGLSDEAGAGPNLLMAMKNLHDPTPAGVKRLEQYIDGPLWGKLQSKDDYSVRASLFYGPPGKTRWNEERSKHTWRSRNYTHQAAIYWSLYRLARNTTGLVTHHSWDWYLRQAFRTYMAIKEFSGPGKGMTMKVADGNIQYLQEEQLGQQVGSVFIEIYNDLRREGWNAEADEFESYTRYRAAMWDSRPYPFGSELTYGAIGHEEIYLWSKKFGSANLAKLCVETIVAGASAVPNWGYNGSEHFYFAAATYGGWRRFERELHWYTSSLCAIPLLDAYRRDPYDLHLLRVGYAGANGVLSNIDANGFGSMSFHAVPDLMEFDPWSADYGCTFYGYCDNAGAYAVKHPEFGWIGFGCNIYEEDQTVRVEPRDAFRQRVFLAPLGLWLTLEAGRFEQVEMDLSGRSVTIALAAADPYTPTARLVVEEPSFSDRPVSFCPKQELPMVRGAWEITLQPGPVRITLQQKPGL